MLRPERMSRVSVTGSRAVMPTVVETIHEQNALDISEYTGTFEGFDPGAPVNGADAAAEKLVTVRSLKNMLDVSDTDAGPTRLVTEEALDEEFEQLRQEVNELDDRREELEDELAAVEERIEGAEPFVTLGYRLDLLSGYDTVDVAVGAGDREAVEAALADADDVAEFDVVERDDVIAVFTTPVDGARYAVEDGQADVLDDAIVGTQFQRFEIPEAEGEPAEYVQSLQQEANTLRSKLETVEGELQTMRLEHGGFLLAVEEKLAIEVEKAEAPLTFATTEHAFVAEGWLPAKQVEQFRSALAEAVGDRVDVDEIERADYTHERETAGAAFAPAEAEAGEDNVETVRADGGAEAAAEEPPVVQKNPGFAKPFEVLVETINRPNYHEIDPTIVLFLTMPAFFGFMIGDVGYGVFYLGVSYWMYKRFDGALSRLGQVGLWLGAFTVLFGVIYGEVFGLELLVDPLWGGHPPLRRGFRPAFIPWAQLWLTVSVLVGLLHLTVGFVFDFVQNLDESLEDAVLESGSWLLLMFGVWAWIFSTHMGDSKPAFLFEVFSGHPVPLGFYGFTPIVGLSGLAVAVVGFALLVYGEGIVGFVESLNVLTHVLSYTRLAAEVLAEGGIAFVIDLLFFGAYVHEGEFHYLINTTSPEHGEIMFGGLMHMGVVGVVAGLLVLVFGHLLVLALGITSAGMQAVRLEYVEFFGKFYEGGGKKYEPFGHDRSYTTQD
ncbi:MAG: V-type ATP synthase subunit I [Haloarculaceae archaeon]